MDNALKSGDLIAIQAAHKLNEQATAQLQNIMEAQKKQLEKSVKIEEKRKKTMQDIFATKKTQLMNSQLHNWFFVFFVLFFML